MFKNRLFNVLIAIALVIVVALTVREVVATAGLIAQRDTANQAKTECASLPSHHSIHNVYVKEMGISLLYTDDSPTGVDGGLIYLLSKYRTCSK